MPMYVYQCSRCSLESNVIRSVDTRDQAPGTSADDSPVDMCTSEEGHNWTRLLLASRVVIPAQHQATGGK